MWYQQEHDACGIGSIVNIDGRKDHKVLDDALHIVEKLEHRAGKDATGEVGDGVGILTQISHKFFAKAVSKAGIGKLAAAEEGDYGVGMFFLPQNTLKRTLAKRMFEVITQKEGMEVLGHEVNDSMKQIQDWAWKTVQTEGLKKPVNEFREFS